MKQKQTELIFKNFTSQKIHLEKLKNLTERLCIEIGSSINDLSILFVNPKRIKRLNKIYREEDQETDVLSFNLGEQRGEIFINPFFQKKHNRKLSQENIFHLIIHGVLHIRGLNHSTQKESLEMRRREEKLFQRCNF